MNRRIILMGVMAAGIVATFTSTLSYLGTSNFATAQMGGGGMDMGGGGMDMGGGGMDMGGGGMDMGGGGMAHGLPGMIREMCEGSSDRPPHYCEPQYMSISSVKGIRISAIEPMGDKSVMVTLREINSMSNGTTERIVVVGGGGDLAGAALVDAGWNSTTTLHLEFMGNGSLYNQRSMHFHLFPLTG
jgi:hypothetical protein